MRPITYRFKVTKNETPRAFFGSGETFLQGMIEGSFSRGEADRVELFDHKYPDQNIEQGKVWANEKFSPQQLMKCFVDLLTINSNEFSAHYSPGDGHADESLTSAQGNSICNKICQAIKSRSIESAARRQLGTADI